VLTRDDLIDLIVAGLAKAGPAAAVPAAAPSRSKGGLPDVSGRLFLTEHEIKKRLTPGGNRLTIPKNSIVSPQAVDWLTLQGIQIVRE
jgi:hypothetical protein